MHATSQPPLLAPNLPCMCALLLLVDACRANAQQPKLFVGMILILIFAEALALYGLIGECFVGCVLKGVWDYSVHSVGASRQLAPGQPRHTLACCPGW